VSKADTRKARRCIL